MIGLSVESVPYESVKRSVVQMIGLSVESVPHESVKRSAVQMIGLSVESVPYLLGGIDTLFSAGRWKEMIDYCLIFRYQEIATVEHPIEEHYGDTINRLPANNCKVIFDINYRRFSFCSCSKA